MPGEKLDLKESGGGGGGRGRWRSREGGGGGAREGGGGTDQAVFNEKGMCILRIFYDHISSRHSGGWPASPRVIAVCQQLLTTQSDESVCSKTQSRPHRSVSSTVQYILCGCQVFAGLHSRSPTGYN